MTIEKNIEWKIWTLSNQEISYTREFSKKNSWDLISLFDTLKNSTIDSRLNKLESRTA